MNIAACIAGAAAKIYDDGVDNNFITDPFHIKILETLQCYLLGALSVNNFTFTVIMIITIFISYIGDKEQYKNPYELSLLTVSPIFLLLSFHTIEYLSISDILLFIYFAIFFFLEPRIIKEEKSPRKFLMRLCICIQLCIFLYLDLGFSMGINLIVSYYIGYTLLSSIFQGYSISHMNGSDFIRETKSGIINGLAALSPLFSTV
jgi:hypothetical protein